MAFLWDGAQDGSYLRGTIHPAWLDRQTAWRRSGPSLVFGFSGAGAAAAERQSSATGLLNEVRPNFGVATTGRATSSTGEQAPSGAAGC